MYPVPAPAAGRGGGSRLLPGSGGVDCEGHGDDVTVGEPELRPQLIDAGGGESGVHAEVGAEGLAGQGEHRAAVGVGDLGVLVGEVLPVGAHDHDVAGGGQVGLQVVDRVAGGGVGERVVQVAHAPGLDVALELHADPVDDHAARPFGEGHRCRRGAGDGDHPPGVHVGHLPLPAKLGVDDVAARRREGDVHSELPGAAGGLRVDVSERAEVVPGGDQVHPRLVAAGQVLDRLAGGDVDDGDHQAGRLARAHVGRQVEADVDPGVGG